MAFAIDRSSKIPRIYDPERGLDLFQDDRPTGSSGFDSMKMTGPDFTFRFYVGGTSRWRYYGLENTSNEQPGFEKEIVKIVKPDPPKNAHGDFLRACITEALIAYRTVWGRGRDDVTFEVVFDNEWHKDKWLRK